jgi:DNA processing protein
MTFPAITIRLEEPAYPSRLRAMSRPPEWLEMRGRLLDCERAVTIVGARAAEARHTDAAFELARALVARGVLVVSGGALGVDAAAHRGALAALADQRAHGSGMGSTAAVLGCGVDVTYPEQHGELFRDISAHGGALLSQFAHDAPPRPWHFARRNETMAALADAVVVMGASTHSGSLQTAHAARKLGRLVAAMPGSPGCQKLIASGAAVVETIEDLERVLSGADMRAKVTLPAPGSLSFRVLSCLDGHRAKDIDDIGLQTGLSTREIQRALTDLELDGLVVLESGHRYLCSQLALVGC